MSAFQRRLDILECIPSYPKKISTKEILTKLENANYQELSLRKVQRDLEIIEAMGMYGVEADKRSKPYGWSINLNWRKLNISVMDENTALAFSTLKQVASNLLPESTIQDLDDYFTKSDDILKHSSSELIANWTSSVALANSPSPVILPDIDKTTLSMVKNAIFHKKQIKAELRRYLIANQQPIWLQYSQINPLGLIQREHGLTLVCSFGSYHQKLYKLPLSFIRCVDILQSKSISPKGYDFKHITQAFFENNATKKQVAIRLKIRKDCYFVLSDAKLAEDQLIENSHDDEHYLLSATVVDTPKLRAFLRGLGMNIEVLAPENLRDYFKELAKDYMKKYS